MRLRVASLRRVAKGDLTIQFGSQALTSYGGLELLGRYVRQIDLGVRLRQAFVGLRSDYGSARIALVLLALFYAGARRLEHGLRVLRGNSVAVALRQRPGESEDPGLVVRYEAGSFEAADEELDRGGRAPGNPGRVGHIATASASGEEEPSHARHLRQ